MDWKVHTKHPTTSKRTMQASFKHCGHAIRFLLVVDWRQATITGPMGVVWNTTRDGGINKHTFGDAIETIHQRRHDKAAATRARYSTAA